MSKTLTKTLLTSGFVIAAVIAFTAGLMTQRHSNWSNSQPKLYEVRIAQYENTKNYLSNDGKTSTRITQGEKNGMKYQVIETQSINPKNTETISREGQNQENIQDQIKTADNSANRSNSTQRDLMVAEMNNEINSTLSRINQLNKSLEPGIMIPRS
jgi:hypothetical protein